MVCDTIISFELGRQLYLDSVIHTAGQDKMGSLGEPADDGHSLVVPLPDVDLFLGDEALVGRCVGSEVHANIMGSVKEIAALVIDRVVDWITKTRGGLVPNQNEETKFYQTYCARTSSPQWASLRIAACLVSSSWPGTLPFLVGQPNRGKVRLDHPVS